MGKPGDSYMVLETCISVQDVYQAGSLVSVLQQRGFLLWSATDFDGRFEREACPACGHTRFRQTVWGFPPTLAERRALEAIRLGLESKAVLGEE